MDIKMPNIIIRQSRERGQNKSQSAELARPKAKIVARQTFEPKGQAYSPSKLANIKHWITYEALAEPHQEVLIAQLNYLDALANAT